MKALRHCPLVAAIGLALASMGAEAATYTVLNNGDATAGSLREAINQANSNCASAPHVIQFSGPFVISPSSPLPTMLCQVAINPPGPAQRNDVILDGQFSYGGSCGLAGIGSALPEVHSLTVRNFAGGFGLCGNLHARNNKIENVDIAMDLDTGSIAYGNTIQNVGSGIEIFGAGSVSFNNVAYLGFEGIYAEGDMYGGRPTVESNVVNGAGSAGFNLGISAYNALEVKGNTVSGSYIGISVNGSGLSVVGNTVIDNTYGGIVADDGALVEGNFVGGNETGIYANAVTLRGNFVGTFGGRSPNQVGIVDHSFDIPSNVVDNFVSGNSSVGILLDGFGGTVSGNRVGTNEAGTAALPNDGVGIFVARYASDYLISNNTVSGNNGAGIFVEADGLALSITGNKIGTNSAGTAALGNGAIGIDVPCGGSGISIKSNTVSGNASHGIWLGGVQGDATYGSIDGNYIGTSAGDAIIPNGGNGVTLAALLGSVECADPQQLKMLSGNGRAERMREAKLQRRALASATAKALRPKAINMSATNDVPVTGNAIKHNQGSGIEVRDDGQGNYWSDNSITANSVKNIDLNGGVALANDDGDGDAGNNLKQNHAEITAVTQTVAGNTEVTYILRTALDPMECPALHRVDFFANAGAGVPAGLTPITPMTGIEEFTPTQCGGTEPPRTATFSGQLDFVSATTKNQATRNTSEFSAIVAAVAAPAVAISPEPVTFGQVPMFGTATRAATLTSVGGQPWRFSSFSTDSSCGVAALKAAVSACAAPFTCETTCVPATDVANGGSCTLTATYAPTAVGVASQTIYLCDNAHLAGAPITLTGEGLPAAVATVTPTTWNFGSVRVGQKSTFKAFSVVNENPVATTIGSITVAGDFVRESTTCPVSPATLAAGAGCEVVVSFAPAIAGPGTGTLRVVSGGGGLSDGTAALQGNGTQVAEIALPPSLDFGTYTLGSAPIVRSITITNTGNTNVVFSSVTATSPFTVTNGCGTTLAPNASCTFSLGFTVTAEGSFTGSLTVSSNAQGSGSVALTGAAQAAPVPLATFSATTLNLGTAAVGTTTAPGSITVTSSGTAPYVVTRYSTDPSCAPSASVCGSGEFLCSLGCDPSIAYAPGSSCTISARFSPLALGVRTAKFYVCDNTTASPRAITLTGEGINPTIVDLAPSTHAFGTVQIGQQSEPQAFTIVNAGGRPATLSAPFTTGSFRVVSHNCPTSLTASQRCTVLVAFAPTFGGAATGQLILQAGSGSGASSAIATLTGIGGTQPVLELPASLDFGSAVLGSGGEVRTATLTNSGNSPLEIASVTLAGAGFALENNCPSTVAPGASCSLRVTFTATATGEFTGTLTVVGNAAGGPRTVQLVARAQPQPVPVIRVSPGLMGFGERQIGSQSATQRVTVSNVGGASAAIERFDLGPDYVIAANGCGSALAAQQSCTIDLALRPVGFGPRTGRLDILTNAEGSPHTVNLSGTGCRPYTAASRNAGRNAACAP
jgi:hypothetical protein